MNNALLRRIVLIIPALPGMLLIAPATGDDGGPVGNDTVTIGGDQFSVDPRQGALNYGYTFFQGNVNYGQTPFSLALQYQQSAAGTYVGNFTDSHSHSHPYGVSAYLPTAVPETNLPDPPGCGGSFPSLPCNDDDAGGIWDLNLPVLFINTAYASTFYGTHEGSNDSDQHPYVTASLTLNDTSYQYLTPMAWFSTDEVHPVPWDVWSQSFIANAKPLYSKDTSFLTIGTFALSDLGAGYSPPSGATRGISVQDKTGTTYYFAPAVLYGWEGPNVYKPSYSPNNNSTTPKMDQLFVYRIARIVSPTGLFLRFAYTDNFTDNSSHTVTVFDTVGNQIAGVSSNPDNATVAVADATDTLQNLYRINFTGTDFRVKAIVNLSNQRAVEYTYVTNQSVPYSWNNQTVLSSITNKYTGYTTAIAYQQFNADVYDAGCNKFLLGQVAVDTVKNYDNNGNEISKASYDFGFSDDSKSNFIMPQKSGDKTYGSGLAHWLDGLYYHENHDSSGCSSSDTVIPIDLTYGTTISTTYPNADRNRTQTLVYDAYGRTQNEAVTASGGWNAGQPITTTSYSYAQTPGQLQALGTYSALPMAFASPASTTSGMNFCTLNGSLLSDPANTQGCMIYPTQSWVYDAAGNPTQEVSRLGQLTEYSYLPASQTNPPNERLAVTAKLHSIGLNGASYVLQTQQFQNIAVAPPSSSLPALPLMTLPVSNTEVHFDAPINSTYTYRTDSIGGYITGNTAQPVLNGILTQRTQQDDTGVSDVVSLTTQYAPGMSSAAGGQTVLNVTSTLTGQAQGGGSASRNRGSALVSSMGYPMTETDGLGRATTHAYDAYGRTVGQTYLPGTSLQQASTTSYDDALSFTPQPINGQAASTTLFSVRTTDPYGNVTIKTYDARQRQTGTFEQRVGSAMVQTQGYLYMSESDDRLAAAIRYGDGWQKQEDYYYAHGAAVQVATVPNVGLADGTLIDGINGNTLTFQYAPGATPTTIGTIYGPVKIVHAGLLDHLVLAAAQIDAGAATAALAGIDLANIPAGWGMTADDYNLWTSSGNSIPVILNPLYTAIGKLPGNAITPGNADNLLQYTTYGYDEWNRQISSTLYSFFNAGTDPNNAALVLSKTTTARTYNTGQRAVTTTYPQGQQETRTYNLPSGLQSAHLAVNAELTDLGLLIHDGLGRVVQYDDTLNGGTSTATYAPGTGLLTGATDAYGNRAAYTYDPTSFLLTQSVLTPAAGGSAITVNRSYDNHLKPTATADSQGAVYGRSYGGDGSLATATTQYFGQTINGSGDNFGNGFVYDAYGDLTSVMDAYLPSVFSTGTCSQDGQSPAQYVLNRDAYGRLASLALPTNDANDGYYGVVRSRAYDAVTGLLSGETKAQLPRQLNCDPTVTGNLSLTTALGYDQNLRPILKSVTRSDVAGTAPTLPAGVADLALTVATATKGQTNKDLSYTITVKNKSPRFGGQPATGVTLSFVPAGAAAAGLGYTSIPAGCTADGSGLSCSLADLSGGQQVRLSLKVRPSTTGGLTPTLRARSAALDPNGRNDALTAAANVCTTSTCAPGAGIVYLADSGTGGSGPVGTALFAVTYDAANHIAQSTRHDFAATSLTENFTYDLQTGALVGYANNGGTAAPATRWPDLPPVSAASYVYDLYGNLTSKGYVLGGLPNGGVAVTLTPDADHPFRLASVVENWFGPASPTATPGFVNGSYTYDLAGNVTADPYGRTYSYDAHGLLGSVTRADGGSQVLLRDGLGRIMQRQATWLADSVLDYGHARSSNHQWQVGLSAGTTYVPEGQFEANTQPNTLAVTDLLGRPVNTLTYGTNPAGLGVLANTSYLPEGIATNLAAAAAGFPAGIANTAQYPAGAMGTALGIDVGTGLEFKGGYRAYDPAVGRFVQWDSLSPLGRGGLNGYAYAGNDPVNFDDPTGQYREAKTHRYGPKPPHAHHEGFWQGFAAGLKAGAEQIYLAPYHWGKTVGHDFATGNMGGLGKMAYNQLYQEEVYQQLGGPGEDVVFSEFVTLNGSAGFSGGKTYSTHVPFKGNAYQVGYQLGDQSAAAAEMVVLDLITVGTMAEADAALIDIEVLSIDADVTADSAEASDAMLDPDRDSGVVVGRMVNEGGNVWRAVFDSGDAAKPLPVKFINKPREWNSLKYGDLRLLRKAAEKDLGPMKDWSQGERDGLNETLSTPDHLTQITQQFDFQTITTPSTQFDFASAMEITPKSVYVLKPLGIVGGVAAPAPYAGSQSAQEQQPPDPNADAAARAPGSASPPVPYQ